MSATPIRDAVRARLAALWADLRGAVTLRRREKRRSTYLLRLLCLALLAALPVWKLAQLGPVGFALAAAKVALAAALVVGLLAAVLALDAWRARRGAARG